MAMKLGFIGTGAITEAIVVGLMEAEYPRSEIIVSARGAATAARLAASFEKVRVCNHNQDIVDGSDLLFLAIRPQIAEEVISSLAFLRDRAIVSLIAMLPAEKIAEWIRHPVDVTRAIPLPSVANRFGVTVVYPACDRITQLFGALGTVVNATSIEEFNSYGAAGSLMATYFGCLETAVQWMVDHGAEYGRARTYVAQVFLGLAQTTIKSDATFEALVGAHSTPQGLNEQAYRVFAQSGGTDALVAAMDSVADSVATRTNSSFT
jgi:pyrroline-5-carboxylate reductase